MGVWKTANLNMDSRSVVGFKDAEIVAPLMISD